MCFPSGSVVKNLSAMQETKETQVLSLGQEDPLEGKMTLKLNFSPLPFKENLVFLKLFSLLKQPSVSYGLLFY